MCRSAHAISSQRQAHLLQQRRITWIASQTVQQRVRFHFRQAIALLGIRPLQPLKRPVHLAAERIHLGNLEVRLGACDQVLQLGFRFLLLTQGMVGQRQTAQLILRMGLVPRLG